MLETDTIVFFGSKHSSILQVITNTCRTTSIITCFKMPQHVLPSIYSIVIVQPGAPANQIDSSCENRLRPLITHSPLPKSAQTAENANRSPWRAYSMPPPAMYFGTTQ